MSRSTSAKTDNDCQPVTWARFYREFTPIGQTLGPNDYRKAAGTQGTQKHLRSWRKAFLDECNKRRNEQSVVQVTDDPQVHEADPKIFLLPAGGSVAKVHSTFNAILEGASFIFRKDPRTNPYWTLFTIPKRDSGIEQKRKKNGRVLLLRRHHIGAFMAGYACGVHSYAAQTGWDIIHCKPPVSMEDIGTFFAETVVNQIRQIRPRVVIISRFPEAPLGSIMAEIRAINPKIRLVVTGMEATGEHDFDLSVRQDDEEIGMMLAIHLARQEQSFDSGQRPGVGFPEEFDDILAKGSPAARSRNVKPKSVLCLSGDKIVKVRDAKSPTPEGHRWKQFQTYLPVDFEELIISGNNALELARNARIGITRHFEKNGTLPRHIVSMYSDHTIGVIDGLIELKASNAQLGPLPFLYSADVTSDLLERMFSYSELSVSACGVDPFHYGRRVMELAVSGLKGKKDVRVHRISPVLVTSAFVRAENIVSTAELSAFLQQTRPDYPWFQSRGAAGNWSP